MTLSAKGRKASPPRNAARAAGRPAAPLHDPVRTTARAAALAEGIRRYEPAVERPSRPEHRDRHDRWSALAPEQLDGGFRQAVTDGAVEAARQRLEHRIRAHMPPATLELALTNNRYTMISVRREPKQRRYRLRLHHMFTDASPTVARALADYVAHNDPGSSRLLSRFIDEHQHRVAPRQRRTRSARLVSRGDCHDLQELFDDLNRRYFAGKVQAQLTWGPRLGRLRRRNSIKMGSYNVEDRLIRIHRTLDRPFVPRYFVEWIIYHEMLHQVHGAPVVNGRRQFHTREFRQDEARFDRYPEARDWERANIDRLLTC